MTLTSRVISLLLTPLLILGPLPAQTSAIPPTSATDTASSQALRLRIVEGGNTEVPAGSRAVQEFLVEVTGSNGAAVPDAAVTFRLPDAEPTGRFADGTHAAVAYTGLTGRAKIDGIRWNAAPGTVPIRVTATKGTAHAGILIQQTLAPVGMAAFAHPVSQTPAFSVLPPTATPLPLAPPFDTQLLAKAIPPEQLATAAPPPDARPAQQNPEPAVSVTSASPGESKHSSKTKWIILAAVAAAAGGAGVAMMGKKSSASNPTALGISIGPPTVSVGHP
ncbi:MAG: hypothetical protein ACR2JB_12375 [Bryobacteraceae bacterium]